MPADNSVGLVWVTPPDALQEAIKRYGDKVLYAVGAVAGRLATIMQNDARAKALWEDRTGNARSGIFGTSEVDYANHIVTIFLSHGPAIDYGVFLELAKAGRYAIIMPTMEQHLPELRDMLQQIFD